MKLLTVFIGGVIVSCWVCLHTASADPFEWAGGVDSWAVLDDWLDYDNPDGSDPPDYAAISLPGPSDDVYVDNGGTPEIAGSSSAASLTVDQNSSVILAAGSLDIGDDEIVGDYGSGTFNQSGGSNAGLSLDIGENAGAHGTYVLSAGSLDISGLEAVGYNGSGTFNQSGGANVGQAGNAVVLGVNAGSQGAYTLSGGTVTLTSPSTPGRIWFTEMVGDGGNGTFTQNGGTQFINQALVIGCCTPQVYGLYNLNAGSLNVFNEWVGYSGSGTFNQTGGMNTLTNDLLVGGGAGSSGFYYMRGGTNTIGNFLWLAQNYGSAGTYITYGGTMTAGDIRTDGGQGTFTMYSGHVNFGGGHWIRAGINSGSVANYTITGGILTNGGTGYINVGESGTGSLNLGGTAAVSSTANGNNLQFGQNSGGVGTVHVYGNASLSVWDIRTDSGHGTFLQDGGTVNAGGWLRLGINANSVSAYTLNSGNANLNLMAQIGENGSGTLNVNGGTMQVAQDVNLGLGSGNGIVNLTGGSLSVSGNENLGVGGTWTFNQTGGANTVAGNLTLAVNPGSSGTYTLLGGALNVSGWVTVNSGGTLSGTGTVSGSVANGGAVAPGNPMGTLTVNGSYTQLAPGALNIVIGGTTAGSQYDQLTVTGAASVNGTLNIIFANGFLPQIGDQFTVTTSASISGQFSTVNGADLANGLVLVPQYSSTTIVLVVTARTVSGHVYSSCGGSHIANASVNIGSLSAVSASDGSYSISGIPAGTYTATVTANTYASLTTTGTIPSSAQVVPQDFPLYPLLSVTGHIYCSCDSSPVTGVAVQIASLSGTTDANGSYTISGISPGTYPVTIAGPNYNTTVPQ